MKFPNHVILDFSKSLVHQTSRYWTIRYIYYIRKNINIFWSLTFQKKFLTRPYLASPNKITKNQKKFTVRHNKSNAYFFLSEKCRNFYLSFFQIKIKVKHRDFFSKSFGKNVFDLIKNPKKFNTKYLGRMVRDFKFASDVSQFRNNKLWNLFDINFIKKEKIYTKLKYSRVPQYDIVSGGVAAIFAGFLGFLICEKFGFELLDSGDFYFLFMYIVFICFFLRTFLKIMENKQFEWNVLSFRWFLYFYQITITLLIKKISFHVSRIFENIDIEERWKELKAKIKKYIKYFMGDE